MIKKLLKLIWNSIENKPENNAEAFNEHLIKTTRDAILDVPGIDEETRKKNELSQKIFDVIKGDLERYPPHEWTISKYMDYVGSYYTHKCVSYALKRDYNYGRYSLNIWDTISVIFGSDEYGYLTDDHRQELYKIFIIPMAEYIKRNREKQRLTELEKFMDDSKRIVCKENE